MSGNGQSDRIDDLFLAAIELPTSERRDFIVRETANDPREVRDRLFELIDAEDEVGTEFAGQGPLNLQTLSAEDLPDVRLGEQIGDFILQERIASGGFGTVYRATREKPYKEEVAIKLLHRENLAAPPIVQRVLREMQALSDLRHPYIVSQLQSGVTEQGEPYLVMEFISGRTLNEHCDEYTLSIEERLKLFQKICEAVSFAHEHDWVHRDLKPGNILVTEDGTPKLLDFGIAKLSTPAPLEVQATLTHGILGTPQYMSPEQFTGRPAGPAADVYALGAILYELLSGHRVYDVMCQGIDQVVLDAIQRAVCETMPRKPSTVVTDNQSTSTGVSNDQLAHRRQLNPATLRRCLSGDIDNIAMMALRKEPERRYASAVELQQDIQRWLEHRPVKARADSLAYRSSKFLRRNRSRIAIALAFAVCLSVGALAMLRGRTAVRDRDLQAANKHVQSAQVHLDQDEVPQAVAQLAAAYKSAPNGPMKASLQRMLAGWSPYLGQPLGDEARLHATFTDDASMLVTSSISGISNVYRLPNLQPAFQCRSMPNCNRQIVSPNGRWLAQQADHELRITDLDNGEFQRLDADRDRVLSIKFTHVESDTAKLQVLSRRGDTLELRNWQPLTGDQDASATFSDLQPTATTQVSELQTAEFAGPNSIVVRYQNSFEILDAKTLRSLYESDPVDSTDRLVVDEHLIAQGFRQNGEHKTLVWDGESQESSDVPGRLVDIDASGQRLLQRSNRRWVIRSLREPHKVDAETVSPEREPLNIRSTASLVGGGNSMIDADFELVPSRHVNATLYDQHHNANQQRLFYVLPSSSTIKHKRDQQRNNVNLEAIRFSKGGKYAVLTSLNPKAETDVKPWLWNCRPYFHRRVTITRPPTPVRGMTSDRRYALSYSNDQLVCFDTQSRKQHERRISISSIALDETRGLAYAGDSTGHIQLLNVPTLDSATPSVSVTQAPIRNLALNEDGSRLLVLTPNLLQILDVDQLLREPADVASSVAMDWKPSSNLMGAKFASDNTIVAWSGQQIHHLDSSSKSPTAGPQVPRRSVQVNVAFEDAAMRKDRFILARVYEGKPYIADANSLTADSLATTDTTTETSESAWGSPLATRKPVTSLAIHPNGAVMAVGFEDGSVQFWDTYLRTPLCRQLAGLSKAVENMVFSRDGRLLTAATTAGTIATYRCQFQFPADDDQLQDHLAIHCGYEWNQASQQIQRLTAERWSSLWNVLSTDD